ncbi:response regulator [Bacillus sp. Marseille-Q3570]|uniref:response regulator transcription factor n=1 Tax=Bacillus sp. Marseille-Q3570 TaxID=2963522 RepID=UPI0021B805DF|nr:response regulator [Bacillus sp. Marseille-Q3570]
MFRVMIVDDEPVIKKSVNKLISMEHANFKVDDYANNGLEAFKKVQKNAPDLIITDVRMPRMDGIELIQKIGEITKNIKVVVISGYDEFEYVQKALRHGAVDYVLKPIKPKTFHEVMKKVEEQLYQNNLLKPETRDWLWKQKNLADQLIEAIWNINSSQCNQLIELCSNSIEKKALDSYTTNQFYLDLYRYLYKEILLRLDKEYEELSDVPINLLDTSDKAYGTVKSLITDLCNEVQKSRNWNSYSKVQLALHYINENYKSTDLTLQAVADEVGISQTYFSRQFKEELGISFIHYVTKMRMEEAQILLRNVTLKTYEVADLVGYIDYPHFTKTFKKYTGMSPKDFRKGLKIMN